MRVHKEKHMSKIISWVGALVVLLAVVSAPSYSFAKTENAVAQPVTTQPAEVKPEYPLPYPGVLPDHPLYSLKALRDKILDMLIVDPIRKSEFYILQGDKRLQMGVMLVDKGRTTLGEQVVSKGEKYMYQAVYGLMTLKQGRKEIPGYLLDRLEQSLAKHAEVLGTLVTRATEPDKSGLAGSLELVGKLTGELPKLK
ncbi:MAG: hypothetical protein UY27_C0012G0016 [Candidatus Gottesmanbacteria bacterium GW2011_GWA1_48_13]|uniref:DUF5667 domain-containing protein n=2 Tax=Candidatus Gottesmaniibacteriota TaxID=1752720 RepID=A0A0G1UNC0_9BACT|nr:MAG: hypothetical protein UY27_C0012G0016 [Candidatus Gottesmanbacteria bacterium GW2011_GWA1_48_13]